MCRTIAVCALALLGALDGAERALHVEAKLKGDSVTVEAFFDDNMPAVSAQVTVFDKSKRTIAAGQTDRFGAYRFPRPKPEKYELAVDAGEGRSQRVTITIPAPSAFSAPANEEIVVTSGPTRTELMRYPWLRIALGVSALAGLAAVVWWATRRGATF